jgi:hypothetical protein
MTDRIASLPESWPPTESALSREIDRAVSQHEAALATGDEMQARAWRAVLDKLEARIPGSKLDEHAA